MNRGHDLGAAGRTEDSRLTCDTLTVCPRCAAGTPLCTVTPTVPDGCRCAVFGICITSGALVSDPKMQE